MSPPTQQHSQLEVVGLLPAAGKGTRIAPLPFSKELYPVGFRFVDDGVQRSLRPKVVCHYLLERMRLAGVTKVYIVLRNGKWDIPAYFGDGAIVDMHLAYLTLHLSWGQPYTLDQAYPFVRDARVAFGLPDILFQPDDAFVQLLARQIETKADVVLGLFPAHQRQQFDMVDVDHVGRVRSIQRNPRHTHLRYTWIIAAWTPVFTRFMHEHLAAGQKRHDRANATYNGQGHDELFIGDVMQAAIPHGLQVEAVEFPDGTYLDIGTPGDLVKATRSIGTSDPPGMC